MSMYKYIINSENVNSEKIDWYNRFVKLIFKKNYNNIQNYLIQKNIKFKHLILR